MAWDGEMEPLKRVHFFNGQLLSAADLQAEQSYLRDKQRAHNRLLHGVGVAQGLEVNTGADRAGPTLTVSSGHALDPAGNLITLCEPRTIRLKASANARLVVLRFAEVLTDPVPVTGDTSDTPMPSRVEERAEVAVIAGPDETAVVIARLLPSTKALKLDRRYKVRRIPRR